MLDGAWSQKNKLATLFECSIYSMTNQMHTFLWNQPCYTSYLHMCFISNTLAICFKHFLDILCFVSFLFFPFLLSFSNGHELFWLYKMLQPMTVLPTTILQHMSLLINFPSLYSTDSSSSTSIKKEPAVLNWESLKMKVSRRL